MVGLEFFSNGGGGFIIFVKRLGLEFLSKGRVRS